VYLDLDGGRDRLTLPGRHGEYLTAFFAGGDITMRPTQLLPGPLNAEWASPLSAVGFILNLVGVGTGTGDLFSGPFDRIGFNGRGQARGRGDVFITKPLEPRDRVQTEALLTYGRERGLDLRRWSPTVERPLKDLRTDGSVVPIETVLVADPWRLERGFSALPRAGGPYNNAVERVSKNALKALPFGSFLDAPCRLPGGITSVIPFAGCPNPMLLSRPYTQRRSSRPSYNASVTAGSGQVDIFELARRREQESGAVQNFETLPLYLDTPSRGSGYLDALNKRGANFMGCPQSQKRRCRF
jgi:hypothetical protein